jgi:hypothetical protein
MNKLNRIEHGAAAGAALVITLTVVWVFATMGYPTPAEAKRALRRAQPRCTAAPPANSLSASRS